MVHRMLSEPQRCFNLLAPCPKTVKYASEPVRRQASVRNNAVCVESDIWRNPPLTPNKEVQSNQQINAGISVAILTERHRYSIGSTDEKRGQSDRLPIRFPCVREFLPNRR